jgi:hypothetical protein
MRIQKIRYILTLLIIAFTGVKSFCQSDSVHAIKVIAKPQTNKIILRWAPTSPIAWQYANKYGYTVERITMTRKGQLIKKRVVQVLNNIPIKPFPEDDWENVVKDENGNIDNYAAIAVQALYGESFELTQDYSNRIDKVIEKVQEIEKRFTFSLFAADQSLKVARAMGLLYEDTNVSKDEKYLYRIYANVPSAIMFIDTAYVYTSPSDNNQLPKPFDFAGDFSNQTVTLTWNRELFERTYISYIVERSDNGKDFISLGDLPFINTSPQNKPNPELMFRIDSLPDTDKVYYYRLRGKTLFEEFGPWSDTISGQAVIALNYRPAIVQTQVVENKKITICWEFPEDINNRVSYFNVLRSNKADGQFDVISQNLKPETRCFTDEKPNSTNYYIVNVFDKQGNTGSSFPALSQLTDSFPPSKPAIPIAEIDTLGNVKLIWKKGKEEDILGYRVFRSNFRSEEFGQITNNPVSDTQYFDTIRLDNLSREIYYKIAAIDFNYNQSELSEPVLLYKLDTIAPAPPLFLPADSKKEGAHLKWVNSSSKDVVKHVLYKKKNSDENWITTAVFKAKDSINSYIDKNVDLKVLYEYILIAVDSSKNESEPCNSVFARKLDEGIRPEVTNIKTQVDNVKKQIEISWDYPYQDVTHFILYRAQNEGGLKYYKMIPGEETKFIDNKIEINTIYRYKIKSTFSDGSESTLSDEIIVSF